MRVSTISTMAVLLVSCASTGPTPPATQPLDRDSKNHETTGGPSDKTPKGNAAGDVTVADPEDDDELVGTADVSYEDALNAAESKSTDEGIMMNECSVVGGSVAMNCKLTGSATAKFLVQHGVVKGVTVTTDPDQPEVITCMKTAIAETSFRKAPGPTGCTRTFKLSGGK